MYSMRKLYMLLINQWDSEYTKFKYEKYVSDANQNKEFTKLNLNYLEFSGVF